MKKKIHPQYYKNAKVICACGNTWETGSTLKEIHTEICSACHPFYTGKQKLVDSARRVEKFEERAAKKTKTAEERGGKRTKRAARDSKRKSISEKKTNGSTQLTTGKVNTVVNPPVGETGKIVNKRVNKRRVNKVNTAVNKVDKKKLESKTEK